MTHVSAPTLAEIEARFAAMYAGCRRFGAVGGLVERAMSPGDLDAASRDDEGLVSDATLRARGWPLDDDAWSGGGVFHPLHVLPWLGCLSVAEGEHFLTIDGFARAPSLMLQPEAAANLSGATWSAEIRLAPDAWCTFTLQLRGATDAESRGLGEAHLGLRRVASPDCVVIIVLPGARASAELRALLAIDDDALARALDDRLTGPLRAW